MGKSACVHMSEHVYALACMSVCVHASMHLCMHVYVYMMDFIRVRVCLWLATFL